MNGQAVENFTNRIEYIDVAKGIGIFLVIFGHVLWKGKYAMPYANTICNMVYSFHMPLFFVISGMCIKESKTLAFHTVKKMAKIYLIPYFVWTVIYLLLFQAENIAMGRESLFGFGIIFSLDNDRFASAISGCGVAPLWFLYALFWAEVITLAIKPFLKNWKNYLGTFFILGAIAIMASVFYDSLDDIVIVFRYFLIGLFRIFPTTFFVVLGYAIKDVLKKAGEWEWKKRTIIIFFLLGLWIAMCLFRNDTIDVQVYRLRTKWLYFPKAIAGTLIVIFLAQSIHSGIITHIGNKTKELMILHYPPFYWIAALRIILGKLFEPNIFGALLITTGTIGGCLIIDHALGRWKFWRFLMGK